MHMRSNDAARPAASGVAFTALRQYAIIAHDRAFEKLIYPYVDAERLDAAKTKKKLRIEVLR
jgi:hypothetical protein